MRLSLSTPLLLLVPLLVLMMVVSRSAQPSGPDHPAALSPAPGDAEDVVMTSETPSVMPT